MEPNAIKDQLIVLFAVLMIREQNKWDFTVQTREQEEQSQRHIDEKRNRNRTEMNMLSNLASS